MERLEAAAAQMAQELNEQIRRAAESLFIDGGNDHTFAFLCECGCLKTVTRTLAVFDAEGARIDGHPAPIPPPPGAKLFLKRPPDRA